MNIFLAQKMEVSGEKNWLNSWIEEKREMESNIMLCACACVRVRHIKVYKQMVEFDRTLVRVVETFSPAGKKKK